MSENRFQRTSRIAGLLRSLGPKKSYPVPREQEELIRYYMYSFEVPEGERPRQLAALLEALPGRLKEYTSRLRSDGKRQRMQGLMSALDEILPEVRDLWKYGSMTKQLLATMAMGMGELDLLRGRLKNDRGIWIIRDESRLDKTIPSERFRLMVRALEPKKEITKEDFQELLHSFEQAKDEYLRLQNSEDVMVDSYPYQNYSKALAELERLGEELYIYSIMES